MTKSKKCIVMLIFTIMMSIPVAANASLVVNSEANVVNAQGTINKPLEDREKREKIKEDYFKTFEKADKYIPGIKIKGEELYNTRRELMKELRKIIIEKENQPLEENEPKSVEEIDKEKIQKEKTSNEDLHLKDKHRIKDEKIKIQNEETKKAYRDFVIAVDSGDKDSISKNFNIFEESSKNFNELLKNKINEIKSK